MPSVAEVRTDFVLVEADWTVAMAGGLVEAMETSHVIIYLPQGTRDSWCLFSRRDARKRMAPARADMPVRAALGLTASDATSTVDLSELHATGDGRYVVLQDGRLFGFLERSAELSFEADVPLVLGRTTRSVRRGRPTANGGPAPAKRSLTAEFPETVAVNHRATLLVTLLAVFQEAAGPSITVEVPPGSAIDILIQTQRGFVIEGSDSQRLDVKEDEQELEVLFTLRPVLVGRGEIRVLAFYQGQRLGKITLEPTIVAGEAEQPVSAERPKLAASLAQVHTSAPDLSLLIFQRQENGRVVLDLRLNAWEPALGLNFKRFGPITLEMDAGQHFDQFFTDIEDLPLETPQERTETVERLKGLGAHLFETLFPVDLQQELWRLRDRIKSVQVQSEEPWIPWELCRLSGDENGHRIEGPFLCEAYEITRWVQDLPLQPELRLSNMAVIVPGDSGLDFAAEERAYLLSLAQPPRSKVEKVQEIPPTFLELREALASGTYDGWHFTGHGESSGASADRSVMHLRDGGTLTPQDLSGRLRNLGRARPLVFLNACQLGRGGLTLTGVGGWANRFLQAGAGAFIGAYWAVSDEASFAFARTFYDALLAGTPIGRAAREARESIQQSSDPATWLAWAVFADPYAKVVPQEV